MSIFRKARADVGGTASPRWLDRRSFVPLDHSQAHVDLDKIVELYAKAKVTGLPDRCLEAIADAFVGSLAALSLVYVSTDS